MRKSRLPALSACVAAVLLPPVPASAQSGLFLRFAPEASHVTVEHTKKVTIGGGSSTSVSSNGGFGLAAGLAAGVRSGPAAGGWDFGAEAEIVVSAQRLVEGTIQPTTSGEPHDVWSGRWEFKDRFGVGLNAVVGRSLGENRPRVDLLLGIRRMGSEFATGGTNPETGVAGEDRERLARWPLTVGIGASLGGGRPVELRLRYVRSSSGWVVSEPDFRLDYDYVLSGFELSVGIGLG